MSSFVSGFVDFGNLLKQYMLKLQKVDISYVYLFHKKADVIVIINKESQNKNYVWPVKSVMNVKHITATSGFLYTVSNELVNLISKLIHYLVCVVF